MAAVRPLPFVGAADRQRAEAKERQSAKEVLREFVDSAADFCNKRALWGMLAFVFFYRSAEGLLLVEAPLFLQSCLETRRASAQPGRQGHHRRHGQHHRRHRRRPARRRVHLALQPEADAAASGAVHERAARLLPVPGLRGFPENPLSYDTIALHGGPREVLVQLRLRREHAVHDAADRTRFMNAVAKA